MATIVKNTKTILDGNNNIIEQITDEKAISKDTEPDYIKIYTAMFFEFKQFPTQYRELFLQLAMHMTYCNAEDLEGSQLVCVSGYIKKKIMIACGWTSESSLTKGLKALCKCGAIRRVARGQYQVNPEFAGRGAWRYNSKLKQGGLKDLVATFQFSDCSVQTDFIYNDDIDGYDIPDRIMYVAATKSSDDVNASMSDDDVEQS